MGVISVANKSVRDPEISDQSVFRGQYLPLSLSKRGVPYIKKRKKKASAKKEPHKTEYKKIRSACILCVLCALNL
jgi:succinate dehydrogenase/fumarate reductase-like Fe-S protein